MNEMESQTILVVSETSSYLLVTLKEKLEEAGFSVLNTHANIDEISVIKDELCAIFIFSDEKLIENKKGLTYIKDRAMGNDLPIFITGDSEELRCLQNDIPRHLIQAQYTRPINVIEVASSISSFLKDFGKQNKRKILVVDDSGSMLRNVKGWLEEKYQVILANSGAMAIKYLAMNRPDLVLLDYEMPVVDGKQVLEMIRSEHEFEKIPVIFLTSKGDKESVMQVMSLKPEGYLLKTMPPAQIIQAVDDFFEKSKAYK